MNNNNINNNDIDSILDEYYAGLGRVSVNLQILENTFISYYFAFSDEHFDYNNKDKINYTISFTRILHNLEKAVKRNYKNDQERVDNIVSLINKARELNNLRNDVIHSCIVFHSMNDEELQLYIYKKRTNDVLDPTKMISGTDPNYKPLSVEEINKLASDINIFSALVAFTGYSYGVPKNKEIFEKLKKDFNEKHLNK